MSLMNIVKLEDQEQSREFDAVEPRCHRERFRGQQREKGERGSDSGIVNQSLEIAEIDPETEQLEA